MSIAPIIPPRIYEQDHATLKAWVISINVSFNTKEGYKRAITHFYRLLELPILKVTEQHISDYREYLEESGKTERTVRSNMTPIRQYWMYAQALQKARTATEETYHDLTELEVLVFAQVQREMAGEA